MAMGAAGMISARKNGAKAVPHVAYRKLLLYLRTLPAANFNTVAGKLRPKRPHAAPSADAHCSKASAQYLYYTLVNHGCCATGRTNGQ